MDRRKIRGGPPMGTRFPPLAPSLDRTRRLADKTIDIDKRPRQTSVVFDMPNEKKELEAQRARKREWYLRKKEEILKRKRERRAALRKPKPAPTPEQIARRRQVNKEACYRYRATHLPQVRWINRDYYHRNHDRLVPQRRERRALAKQNKPTPSPFRK